MPTFTIAPNFPPLVYQAKIKFVEIGNFKGWEAGLGLTELTELKEKISQMLRATDISRVP